MMVLRLVLLLVAILTSVLPLVLVAVGLPFKKAKGLRHFDDGTTINHYDLPDWLRWLQNPEDGLTGDSRGWYWNTYMVGKPAWLKMLWWSGGRNTFNYLKRFIIGIDIRDYVFEKVCGQDYVRDDFHSTGFQVLKADPIDYEALPRYMLYWVKRWGGSNRAIVVQLGWKIKLDHNTAKYVDEWDYFKGVTFEINPFKDIS